MEYYTQNPSQVLCTVIVMEYYAQNSSQVLCTNHYRILHTQNTSQVLRTVIITEYYAQNPLHLEFQTGFIFKSRLGQTKQKVKKILSVKKSLELTQIQILLRKCIMQLQKIYFLHVYVGKIDNKWIYVEEGLYDELSLMLELESKHIRFIIQPEEDNGESSSRNQVVQQNKINIFDTMMERARQPYFSMQKREDIRCDILYNDVITLLRNKQKNGWSGVNSESFANKFVERLVALFKKSHFPSDIPKIYGEHHIYIDPHREKLIARSLKLPDIFNELEQSILT
ncbi:unnamed protein product [Rhizophagus irregularis]|uniref:Uncharacterized protein n=2 Tax=Rhizophagus irregularis TaxID=588596 RepID=A0A916EE60_9GLOM|nr:unnamed protein product [Rhizophagus irregularis]CAB5381044.1 unnamed protein product [Rhizophagus irregularis]